MNATDILIILFVIGSLFRGREIGFIRQLCSTIGFFGGLWIGTLLQPYTIQLVQGTPSRSMITLLTTLGCAVIFLFVGELIGIIIKTKVHSLRINIPDEILGSLLAGVSVLLIVWLSASILNALPYPGVQSQIRGSKIVHSLNGALPPAPNVIANLGHLIDPNGFPQVFMGTEPQPTTDTPLPSLGEMKTAVSKSRTSIVKIEGQGCGGIVEGSGFVVGSDLVATNAHVVAGIDMPYVRDLNGNHSSTVIWFDPDLDFAVLRVDNLAGNPLVFDTDSAPATTPGAALGYPGGGDFRAELAVVTDRFTATGRNIYNRGITQRDIYEVRADIEPGNSGGPLVAKDGSVLGVIFAESTTYNHVGYALSANQVVPEIDRAQANNQPVSTGSCAG